MAENDLGRRPWWVRLFARPGSRRPAVRAGALAFGLLAVLALLVCSIEATRDSLLARIAFGVGAVLAPGAALLAAGAFLAVRWVDHNGKWS
jgi:hypothetical protein